MCVLSVAALIGVLWGLVVYLFQNQSQALHGVLESPAKARAASLKDCACCFPIQEGVYSLLEKLAGENWLLAMSFVVVMSCTSVLVRDFVVVLC